MNTCVLISHWRCRTSASAWQRLKLPGCRFSFSMCISQKQHNLKVKDEFNQNLRPSNWHLLRAKSNHHRISFSSWIFRSLGAVFQWATHPTPPRPSPPLADCVLQLAVSPKETVVILNMHTQNISVLHSGGQRAVNNAQRRFNLSRAGKAKIWFACVLHINDGQLIFPMMHCRRCAWVLWRGIRKWLWA